MTIRPPTEVREPVVVYLVDYEHHASLLLPNEYGGFNEFAYGEWKWFAENHETVLDAIRIALFPSEGTLGRREWPEINSAQDVTSGMGYQAVYSLCVEKLRSQALLRRLNDEFERNRSHEIFNQQEGMTFVPHDDIYWLGWNCNTAAAAWLEALDCRVFGPRHFADFRIESNPRGRTSQIHQKCAGRGDSIAE